MQVHFVQHNCSAINRIDFKFLHLWDRINMTSLREDLWKPSHYSHYSWANKSLNIFKIKMVKTEKMDLSFWIPCCHANDDNQTCFHEDGNGNDLKIIPFLRLRDKYIWTTFKCLHVEGIMYWVASWLRSLPIAYAVKTYCMSWASCNRSIVPLSLAQLCGKMLTRISN